MPIKDQSVADLPTKRKEDGEPPRPQSEFVNVLANAWYAAQVDKGLGRDKANVDLPYRASYASQRCDRQLYYSLTDKEKSNPSTIADTWRMELGSMVHDALEKHLPAVHPHGKSEVVVDLQPIGIPGSAHADLVVYDEGGAVDAVVEFKSINGFGFKMCTTSFKGPPEGPRSGHVLQAAMVAVALNAARVVVGYLSLENLSPQMASSFADSELARFTAEWEYSTDEVREMVAAEAVRIERLLRFRGTDLLPSRELVDPDYPTGAVVDDPGRGTWKVRVGEQIRGSGTTWMCGYCDHKDSCIKDGE